MIYLDYNATHPPVQSILAEALEVYQKSFANSSGLSAASQQSNKLIEESRDKLSSLFGLQAEQIIFTSSASEANGLVISALNKYFQLQNNRPTRILTNELEHPSVVENVKKNTPDLFYMPVKNDGTIDLEKTIAMAKQHEVDFITLIAANNETGILQPVQALAEAVAKPIVCDAVQLLSRMSESDEDEPMANFSFFQLSSLHNIFFTLAGHKIGAGFGAGVLIRPTSKLGKQLSNTVIYGGGSQEFEIRPGSHNLTAIYAMAKALEQQQATWLNLQQLTHHFEKRIVESLESILNVKIIGQNSPRLPGTSLISFPGLPIDFFLMGLDKEGIIVSTGTSCKSRSRTPSAGLLAMGLSEEVALSVLRFSFDLSFTVELQEKVIVQVKELARRLK